MTLSGPMVGEDEKRQKENSPRHLGIGDVGLPFDNDTQSQNQ